MKRQYTIAVSQMDSQDDKTANLDWSQKAIEAAAARGASLVSFPEVFNVIDKGAEAPEDLTGGRTISFMQELARKHKLYLHCGSIAERVEGAEKKYNTTVLLDPQGEMIAVYRKLHLFDITMPDGSEARESDKIQPGNEIVTVETELGHLGLSICYDIRFPELYRAMALMGAQVIFTPANFTLPTGKDHWEPILRARAIENGVYIVASAQMGRKRGTQDKFGSTLVADPWGTVVAKAPERPSVIYADIDLDYADKVQRNIPGLVNRRSDVYRITYGGKEY